MDGNYTMVPSYEYYHLCELDEFFKWMIRWLNEPENFNTRQWLVEQLTDESLPPVYVGGSAYFKGQMMP